MSLADFLLQLAANPVFAGVAGGAGMSALLYQMRALPKALWELLKRQLTVHLVIDNSEGLFDRLSIYLSRLPAARSARWLRMVELYDDEAQKWEWQASLGNGFHVFRDHGTWFLLWRSLDEKNGGQTLTRRESITVRTLGSSQQAIRDLMKRAEQVYDRAETVRVYVWHDGAYILADRKPARPLDTLFLPAEQKARIIADLDRFLVDRETYRRRGTPYRRGYLFEGPPGTGKTTLALILAGRARRPVYAINLNTCGGDTGLLAAMNLIEAGAVVAIEDVDTARISHERTAGETATEIKVDAEKQVTLAGLLNAIDGLATRENRILVITSNHADKLDAALLRPGRIDVREVIGLIGATEAEGMAEAFIGRSAEAWAWYRAEVAPGLPMSPAALQGMLLGYEESNRPALRAVA